MIMGISVFVSVSIIIALFLLSKQRTLNFERRFQLVMDLHSILNLCRQHCSVTHHMKVHNYLQIKEVNHIQYQLLTQVQHLVSNAQCKNNPLYRVLDIKVKGMINNWEEESLGNSLMAHTKVIYHCMHLLDNVVLALLAQTGRDDLYKQYNMNCQAVLDSMEILTQLQISIQDLERPNRDERLAYYCGSMIQKMNRFNTIHPEIMVSAECLAALTRLEQISMGNISYNQSNDSLYLLTKDISLSISNVYDEVLRGYTEALYLPLYPFHLKMQVPATENYL
ncbi:hypothetical protein [uncultured Vibrio sp.]|uniref:hypothetical protein n=1 Tax=uncultured Vibrio sp. TaxID=114054 RepID=UPI002626CA2F|nr:hypothetical protein [uncultured Vibrio sp.]